MILSELITILVDARIILTLEHDLLSINAPKGAMTAEIMTALKMYKSDLIDYLKVSAQQNQKVSIADRTGMLPLSFAQQRLWLLDQIDGGSAHYNMPAALKLAGELNTSALQQAFTTIFERHESLRTCFVVGEDGQPIQVIQDAVAFYIPLIDLSKLEESARQLQLTQIISDEANAGFDLRTDLMLRAQLIKTTSDEHIVLVTMHHIASDGWSMSILINEFSALYSAYAQGNENPLAPLAIQYADYAHWQRNWLQGEVLDRQLGYWAKQLASLPVAHSLPLDHARPQMQTFAGANYSSHIDAETSKTLAALCQAQGATLFMGLHAAFSVLLSRYSNETDIVVGSPIANREQAEIAGLIGFFVNTLVLRSDLSGNPSFSTLLSQSKTMLLDAYAHQQVPFEQIVERLQPERNLSHSALFQVMLVLQNNEQGILELPGLTLSPVEQTGTIAKYDLTLNVIESAGELQLGWEYNTDLFEQKTISQMANNFGLLLTALVAKPEQNVFNVDMLDVQERQQLLVDWNNTQVDYPNDKCIHELFETQVETNPDAIAVTFENQTLSYQQLNEKANQLAHYLINEKQIKPDTLVGICVERSLEMVVGILAILKAGGAYVPLDPEYPEARLKYMLDDAQLTTVLTQSHLRETTPVSDAQAVCLDSAEIQQQLQTQSIQNPNVKELGESGLTSNNLAYVIYTSGSTGNPKGVLVEHYNITRLLDSAREDFEFNEQDVWTLFHSYAFDFSVWEIWGALAQGGRLVVVPYWVSRSPSDFYQLLSTEGVTVLNQTPSAFTMLVQEDAVQGTVQNTALSLRYVVFGGEALNLASLLPWFTCHGDNQPQLINMYGITETTVHVTYRRITQDLAANASGASLIGKPLSDLQLVVLNDQQRLVPVGVAGEMYVGGAGVTRGYLNQPALTQSRFVSLSEMGGKVFYRTGDLARYLPNGELEYLGRIDHQVKIRGFRIELGEIESALASHELVKDAIVVAKASATGTGDKRLVAYVVTGQQDNPDENTSEFVEQLRQHLSQTLPDYMVPSAFVLLESLPLTTNGKVDRKALPEPDFAAQQNTYVAPTTETEKILCEIWQEVLGVERVGITDNFFQLGGHSLLATRLVARINQTFNVALPLKSLFNAQALGSLAQAILQLDTSLARPALTSVPRDGVLLASYTQQRLWLLDQIDGGSAHYNMPAALKLVGGLNTSALQQAFTTIFERHESLRTCFAVGDDGQPIQIIQAAVPFVVPVVDLSNLEESARHLQLTQIISDEVNAGFDLSTDLMLRAQLIKITTDEHIVLVTMHHIASDGWSMSILINEFSALYSAYAQGNENPLAPLTIQYADYAHWQRNWLQGEVLDQQLGYWEKQLASLPVAHSLPLDHARPQMQTFAGVNYSSHIDAETSKTLAALCQAQGATLFMGLHAAFSVLLSRYSNETDIVVGSPIANREQAEIAGLIGFFVNTLVLRSDLSENPSFTNLLNQSKTMLLDAYAHQQVPFEQIVERLQPERNLSHSALFQVMLVLQNNEQGILELPGLTLSPVEQTGTIAKYDLTLTMVENENGIGLSWEYNTDLFEQKTIAQMANHFGLLLTALVAKPEQNVFNVDILDAQERQQLLVDWNNTQTDYPNDKCIHELFETQVETNPDAIAVTFENQTLSYQQLNEKANQLAHYLINEKHVKPDTLVGICVERSLDMVVGILAILKAGGAYVPLDPEYPEARLKYMLDDAQLTAVLTQSHLRETTPVTDEQAVCLDSAEIQQQLQTQSIQNPNVKELGESGLTSNNLAYVIYTSGSTGNPKGVLVEHYNITRLLDSAREDFSFNQQDVWTLFHSYAFDFSVWEIWGALAQGGRLVVVPYWVSRSPSDFYQLLSAEGVTVLNQTPSAFTMLVQEDAVQNTPLSLRYVVFGGEALNLASLLPWFTRHGDNQPQLINMYGITETTVHVTYRRITQDLAANASGASLIGKPLSDLQLVVLNDQQRLVPVGVAGEMYVGGAGVTRGYLNQPALTQSRFVSLSEMGGKVFYRTGDLARYLPNGELEYLGRIDHQVKIRGFRIELGEIESALASHELVKDAIVLAKASATGTGDKRLVAYVVTGAVDLQNDTDITISARHELIEQLRQHLGQTLPDYMVPSAFVLLESLPLTTNGKVDRKALPEPDFAAQQNTYVAPTTETEKILCEIWQEVLGVERVGITDNFFQLGGHSLLATRLVARINQTFNVALPLKSLFNAQALGSLAQAILQLDTTLSRPALSSVPRDGVLLASYTQQRLWLLDQIDGGSAHYNMPAALKLVGELNTSALQHAFTSILERHESLRTCFVVGEDGQPIQVIQAATPFVVPVVDLSNLKESARESQLTQIISDEANISFDLRADLMLRAQLIKITADEHIVLVTMHHIASDGWSMSILINEFSALYSAYAKGNENPLAPLAIQYADYAHWQRNWLQGEVLDQQLGYWEKQLSSLPVAHSLPLDHARPQMQTFAGANYSSHIDAETSKTLAALCQAQGATLFMGLHAAFSVLLSRYSNETDIVVGSPIANREQAEIAGLIGFFVNTLVLRSDLSENPSFTNLLNQSKTMLLDAYAHQQVPFEQIVERLQPERNLSHSALFQVMLILQNNEQGALELPGLTLSPVEQSGVIAKYDLTLNVFESEQGLWLGWEYNTGLFEQSTIARMANHFGLLLNALLKAPGENVFNVDMLDAQERQQLLVDWNNTQVDYPNDKCIHELFEAQVETNPNAIAITFENQTLSYQQLNEKANQLAHYLINEKQVTPDTLVGICVERSLDMVVGILAILKSGGAYVPLDPEYPEARLKYMLDDAQLTTVLTQSHLRETTPVSDAQAVCLDSADIQQQLQTQSTTNPDLKSLGDSGLTSNNLAYVIYTSGSTGNPKGVMVEHNNIANFLTGMGHKPGIKPQDCLLAVTSTSFDIHGLELFLPLVVGAKLVVASREATGNPELLFGLIKQHTVSLMQATPATWKMLLDAGWQVESPLKVLCGGEALGLHLATELLNQPQLELWNMYGPTETTIWSTTQQILPQPEQILMGQPIANTQIYLTNEKLELAPVGVAGELLIGGAGVTRGYLHRPDLTAEKFIANPFYDKTNPASSERLYKTGDLVRWLPNGHLEFLGRIDHQVKIRGFRIELGEIENALSTHSAVKDAVVIAKESASTGDKRLVAYVVAGQQNNADENTPEFVGQLSQHLHQTLPDYMVPSAFVLLESLPLTPNGKVDRKALPEPDLSIQQNTYVAPTTETEKILCEILQEMLGVERVGITDNFFRLGGHSILLVKLLAQLKKIFNQELMIRDFFELGTIQLLAEKINKQSSLSETNIAFEQVTTKSAEQTEEIVL